DSLHDESHLQGWTDPRAGKFSSAADRGLRGPGQSGACDGGLRVRSRSCRAWVPARRRRGWGGAAAIGASRAAEAVAVGLSQPGTILAASGAAGGAQWALDVAAAA